MKNILFKLLTTAALVSTPYVQASEVDRDCIQGNWTVYAGFYNSSTAALGIAFDGSDFYGRMQYRYEDTDIQGTYTGGNVFTFDRQVNFRGLAGYQTWTGQVSSDCKTMTGSWQGVGGVGNWYAIKD